MIQVRKRSLLLLLKPRGSSIPTRTLTRFTPCFHEAQQMHCWIYTLKIQELHAFLRGTVHRHCRGPGTNCFRGSMSHRNTVTYFLIQPKSTTSLRDMSFLC